jgi:PAS domain S-box-containing protein
MQLSSDQILDSVPFGVLITDLDGRIVGVNATLRDMLGYESGKLENRSMTEITAEENVQNDRDALKGLSDGDWPTPYVKEFLTHTGRAVPVEVQVRAICDGNGKVSNALFAVKDLSEEMQFLKDLQRRNLHLLASSEVAMAATQILDIGELLTRCVDLIRKHFGFYYAAIFLIDGAGEWAVLRAATGEAGEQLLSKGHKLGVGSQSMVGWVTANNAARIALDVGEEAIRFDNPYLPKTRSEMALPLRVRGEVIGALDVQSTGLNAFSTEDIRTIQMMADQVAIAIDNARLFSQQNGG